MRIPHSMSSRPRLTLPINPPLLSSRPIGGLHLIS